MATMVLTYCEFFVDSQSNTAFAVDISSSVVKYLLEPNHACGLSSVDTPTSTWVFGLIDSVYRIH